MRLGWVLCGAVGLYVGCGFCLGQEPARVTFRFERSGVAVPRFSIGVGEDGRGNYRAEFTTRSEGGGQTPLSEPSEEGTPAVERTIVFSGATAAKVFELARAADHFRGECASKAKHIADTGTKRLVYAGADGRGECTFNYSEVKPVAALTELFLSVEATLESGRRLDFKRRFDRLGLDAEMIALGDLMERHQASEVGVIAPTLRAIANDPELLQRVRSRAAKMLEQANIVGQM